eukprot:jgi/Mesvir1/3111/Mv08878-RA.1
MDSAKIAVITGANSGLGYWTCIGLLKAGFKCILACRNAERAAKASEKLLQVTGADPAFLVVHVIDVSRSNSVHAFATWFRGRFSRLDVLVLNAGIKGVPYSPSTWQEGTSPVDLQFATNYLGHFALCGLLLDKVVASGHGRIVSLASIAHRKGRVFRPNGSLISTQGQARYSASQSYCNSKLACLMFSQELARRLASAGNNHTLAVAAHPGWSYDKSQPSNAGSSAFTRFLFDQVLNPLFAQSMERGAIPILHAALAEDVRSGDYWGPDGFMELGGTGAVTVACSAVAKDAAAAAQLWKHSEELTGVHVRL